VDSDSESRDGDTCETAKDLARRLFEKFSNHYDQWKQCIDCVANLDVLGSLAEYAGQQMVICVPELVSGVEQPFVQLEEGYHPCVNASTFIPNGLELGTDSEAPLSLLTGPNMGGKSTLMRELGLLVIMAQIVSIIGILFIFQLLKLVPFLGCPHSCC